MVDVKKKPDMEKNLVNDLKQETLKSHKWKEKESELNERVDGEEGNPKVVKDNEAKICPIPTMMVAPPFPQCLK